jgi:hypothetical protein
LDVASTNGALLGIRTTEVSLSALSGATVTATNLIPAGSLVYGVTARNNTLVTGASSYNIGDGTDADAWGDNIPLSANYVTNSTMFNTTSLPFYKAQTSVVLTANGGAFTAGTVRLVAHYSQVVGPTS